MSGQVTSSEQNNTISLYIHIPFCIKRCNYCDFNTYAHHEDLIPDYVASLCKEIYQVGGKVQERVHTIYFGGGTPSILSSDSYTDIINAIHNKFKLTSNPEISMEVNPGTIREGFLERVYALGINRLSIGMQSVNPKELNYLGRIHTPIDIINTTRLAYKAGFKNVSFDLMFGLPGQTIASWRTSLEFAITLKPTHLSLYSLTYENGTKLNQWRLKGLLPDESEDFSADLYEIAIEYLHKNNFIHYEISNWAAIDKHDDKLMSCKHNMQYWLNKPYIGLGAGAHSFYQGFRSENVKTINSYIKSSLIYRKENFSFAQKMKKRLTFLQQMQETMFMGLRLLQEGVSNESFQKRFNCSIEAAFPGQIAELISLGLVTWKGENKDHLCLTKRGCMVGNQVFQYFVD